MSSKRTIRVVVADGQPFSLDGLARAIHQDASFQLVGAAGDGAGALSAIRAQQPDIAVIDAAIAPGGERIAASLRGERLATRIVLLDGVGSPGALYRALGEGVAGCLTRHVSPDELRRALTSVADGDVVLGDGVPTTLAREIRLRHEAQRPVLSEREQTILRRLADGRMGPEIARELHLAPATVKGYLSRLYDKLGVNDRAAAVAAGFRCDLLE